MFFELLQRKPMTALVWIVVILLSITVHEFAHAWMAYKKGDHTAEQAGRLTLNPIAHIDPLGLLPLLLLGFGWAKPVPFNPYNLKDPRKDSVHIALAGPASNFILAALSAITFRLLTVFDLMPTESLLPVFLLLMVVINLFLLFFNIIPVHPLDGSKLIDAMLIKPHQQQLRQQIAYYGSRILFALVFISIFTSINVFFFVSIPSFLTCNALIGQNCSVLLSLIF